MKFKESVVNQGILNCVIQLNTNCFLATKLMQRLQQPLINEQSDC